MPAETDEFHTAFHAAAYKVALDSQWLTLRIGAACPRELSPWLRQYAGTAPAWLITAHNPGARPSSPEDNKARDHVLQTWAQTHAGAWLNTVNRDRAGDWPDEPGLLLAGVEEGLAHTLAARLGQLAVVAVRAEAAPELVWITGLAPKRGLRYREEPSVTS